MLLVFVRSRPGEPGGRAADRRGELTMRLRIALDDREQLGGRDLHARRLEPRSGCRVDRCPARGACGRSPPARAPAASPTSANGSPTRSGRGCRTRTGTRRSPRRTRRSAGSSRDSAHIAWLGSAESTSPTPAMMGMMRSVPSDRRRDAADHAERHRGHVGGEQVLREQPAVDLDQARGTAPTARDRSASRDPGRAARSAFVSSRSAVSSVRSLSVCWANTQPKVAPIFSVRSGRTSPSISS